MDSGKNRRYLSWEKSDRSRIFKAILATMAMLMLMQKLDSHYKLFTLLYRMENKGFFPYHLLLRSHVFCDGISQYKLLKVVICGVNIWLYAHVLKQFTSLVSLSLSLPLSHIHTQRKGKRRTVPSLALYMWHLQVSHFSLNFLLYLLIDPYNIYPLIFWFFLTGLRQGPLTSFLNLEKRFSVKKKK